jgi:HEAT repeat protein
VAATAVAPSDRADKSEKTTITSNATAGQATAQQPATVETPTVIAASIARLADAAIPVNQRMSEIDRLGQRGDAAAMQILMQLGDTYTYLNYKAVETLGNVKTPEVAKYLAGKTTDKDPRIVSCAVQSLARVQGAEAIPAIAATLAANRQRPDGFQDTVCSAGVKALGEIGSAQAIPALSEEFEKTVGKTLQHEYGSQVVAAFKAIGDRAGVPALEGYAARLRQQKDAMSDNPMGQRYLEGKIKEVEDTVAFIKARVM